jgi:F0F1-type ATP synthase assembly protein I
LKSNKKLYKTKNNKQKTLKNQIPTKKSNKTKTKTKTKNQTLNQLKIQVNNMSGLSVNLIYKLTRKTTLYKCSGTIQ